MIFCKAPIPGQVKTRLAQCIGDHEAAAIHRHLVLHCLNTITSPMLTRVELWCSPSMTDPFFMHCRDEYGVELKQQAEGDLGQRMSTAFRSALQDADFAVAIGTDCPAISLAYVRQALDLLANHQAPVIGPAEDGGYVLLGLRRYQPALFEDIPWGGDQVLAETCGRLTQKPLLLPELWDVDYAEDLRRLRDTQTGIHVTNALRDLLNTVM